MLPFQLPWESHAQKQKHESFQPPLMESSTQSPLKPSASGGHGFIGESADARPGAKGAKGSEMLTEALLTV